MNAIDMHAEIVRGMAGAAEALAEAAVYAPPAGPTVPCTVMFRAPSLLDAGSSGPIVAQARQVRILRADVALPVKGATIALASDPAIRWALSEVLDDGIGSTVWSVIRVRA